MGFSSVIESSYNSITVSIVSHGQGKLVAALLDDLSRCPGVSAVILTQNIPEAEIDCPESLRPRLHLIRNDRPEGFSANHNQAFRYCRTSLFAVVNPDIRLDGDPFPELATALETCNAGMIAPAVRSPEGNLEDSARHFPTPTGLFRKILGRGDGRVTINEQTPQAVDWAAGMFMLFRQDAFRSIDGFDEGFFLYYEDADICTRLWKAGIRVYLHPGISVIHAAQRASRRKPRYMAWHISSMLRYFRKHAWRLPQQRPQQ
ncbi:MAG: glycosyltransferase [Ferrovibrio sp.]|uniref:glycosyltransferase n=1 Tax=Ferrovibrio sp. TaxID=1917215 RepID=UPI00391A0BEA